MANDEEKSLVRISDLFGAAKPLEQLVSAIERGIGSFMRPIQKRRETKADVAAFDDWNEALTRTGLAPKSAELTLGDRATIRLTAEVARKQQNRESIAVEAVNEYVHSLEDLSDPAVRDSKIQEEWLDRFWRLAEDVTDTDMQAVWGRILARKAQSPTKYSARCLEALSLLSKEEALRLENLSKFVLCAKRQNAPYHFFLSNPFRLNSDLKAEEQGKKIREIIGQTYRTTFGPAGFYTDSGSSWALDVHIDVSEGNAFLLIANTPYVIRYPTPTTCVDYIGSGLGISPLGAEIFSLIEIKPDPDYVEALSSALRVFGMKLERHDGTL
ncbi:DUF2806 domain-containing protein [Bradyrhizobium sediminis]|uniref:DUF2806 domain-containing protein n=1 Tax=Bradyrhizobium sediminis TaxID=2840469 RepID=A0A975RR73_9BRAD|nr:DUF2806 domain-containing protein [Bradyrhizobium sediminis]QWG16588.1 DUF2806 domain-containing protein [Bradyrhizobium sediminis]